MAHPAPPSTLSFWCRPAARPATPRHAQAPRRAAEHPVCGAPCALPELNKRLFYVWGSEALMECQAPEHCTGGPGGHLGAACC